LEVPLGASATLADWKRALEATLVQLQPELDAHWQRLTPTEQKTVRAVVAGQGSPYRTAVLARLDLGKASAQEALRNLAARAEVESGAKGYVLVDPLFALWIERLVEGAPVPLEEE
jgi:protein-L-isoaspartate O-methyltransferase